MDAPLRQKCIKENVVGELHVVLHADGTVVFSTTRDLFIKKCNTLISSFRENRLELNFGKSSFMIIHPMNVCLSICLSACMPVYMSIWLYACLYVYLSVCLSACLYVYLPVCLSICLSACMPVYMSICLYACLPVYMSICLYACLYVEGYSFCIHKIV